MCKSLFVAIAVLALTTVSSFATSYSPSTVSVTSVTSGRNDSGGDAVGPYAGTFGGLATTIFCDDRDHNIQIGPTFNVNVSDITDLSLTRFGGSSASDTLNAVVNYEKVFYLSGLLSATYTDPTIFYASQHYTTGTTSANSGATGVNADIQDAIWGLMETDVPNAIRGSVTNQVQYWLDLATKNHAGKDYTAYRILTDSAVGAQYSGVQELFTKTPEPGTIGMLFSGLAAVGFGLRRRNRKVAFVAAS